MTVIKCTTCGKEIKPEKPGRRPFMVFFINQPCASCQGKPEIVAE